MASREPGIDERKQPARSGLSVVDAGGPSAWSTREGWLEAGRRLGERSERDRWALGDWACHGERCYGALAEAAGAIGICYGSLRNLASVSRKVELSRRRDTLSWSHRTAVAALPADVADGLLDRAQAEGRSREVIREEARAASREARLEALNRKLSEENERLREPLERALWARRSMDRRKERLRGLFREIAVLYRQVAEVVEDPAALSDARALHGNTDLRGAIEKVINAGMDRCDTIMTKRIDKALGALVAAQGSGEGRS